MKTSLVSRLGAVLFGASSALAAACCWTLKASSAWHPASHSTAWQRSLFSLSECRCMHLCATGHVQSLQSAEQDEQLGCLEQASQAGQAAYQESRPEAAPEVRQDCGALWDLLDLHSRQQGSGVHTLPHHRVCLAQHHGVAAA